MNTALSHVMSRLGVRWLSEITVSTRPLNLYPIPQTGELASLNQQLQDALTKERRKSEASAEDNGSVWFFMLLMCTFIICKCLKK